MKKETVFIGGQETDADIAREIFNLVRSSVQRVVEALVIAGKTDEQVKAAAKTTVEAVVESMIELVRSKTKAADPVSSSSPANPSK